MMLVTVAIQVGDYEDDSPLHSSVTASSRLGTQKVSGSRQSRQSRQDRQNRQIEANTTESGKAQANEGEVRAYNST